MTFANRVQVNDKIDEREEERGERKPRFSHMVTLLASLALATMMVAFASATTLAQESTDETGAAEADMTRLTDNPEVDRTPTWSPDGSRIAFHSKRDANNDVYVMNADGSNIIRLTDNPAWDGAPSWSPAGNQIAFHSSNRSLCRAKR